MGRMNKLNIGCGQRKKNGFINVDNDPRMEPEILHDLNTLPYPFPENYFDHIEADHVLEHLAHPIDVMKELHRILKPEGTLEIRVPHFSRAFTHPDHWRGFDITFPYYFRPSFTWGYMGVHFECPRYRYTWFAQEYLKKTVLPPVPFFFAKWGGIVIDFFANLMPVVCSRVWCFWVGGFEQVEFHFVCKKEITSKQQ